jgi:2-oxo-4-hydroxy-4-carboxy-5-ureidoimidazoline decarboxylase
VSRLSEFNLLSAAEAEAALLRCCGSRRWASALTSERPFSSLETLYSSAEQTWFGLSKEDWMEAFSHHPRIGDTKGLKEKFSATQWAADEQKGATRESGASEDVLGKLASGNEAYERRFGYVFLVCATGKSAAEMLGLLEKRILNPPDAELKIAVFEQNKITRIRLEKHFHE